MLYSHSGLQGRNIGRTIRLLRGYLRRRRLRRGRFLRRSLGLALVNLGRCLLSTAQILLVPATSVCCPRPPVLAMRAKHPGGLGIVGGVLQPRGSPRWVCFVVYTLIDLPQPDTTKIVNYCSATRRLRPCNSHGLLKGRTTKPSLVCYARYLVKTVVGHVTS